jgi:hypothetical protein
VSAICGPLRKIPSLELPIKDRSGKEKRLTKIPERVCQASGSDSKVVKQIRCYEPVVNVLADRLKTLLTALPRVGRTAIAAKAMNTSNRALHHILAFLIPDELLYHLNHGFVLLCLDVLLDRQLVELS